jgi:hypothetical protein
MSFITGTFLDLFTTLSSAWKAFSNIWYIAIPLVFYYPFKIVWLEYRQMTFAKTIEFVSLEIIPPRDIEKSPKPMESVFIGISGILGTFTNFEVYGGGKMTEKFSFEIVGIEGKVHFYLRVPKSKRKLIEAHFYAQYQGVEIVEVSDYVNDVPRLIPNKKWDLWGTDFELVKPDPYPIRTYKYFEEEITGTMIDPFSALVEAVGKTGPGEQIWLQYVIVPEFESEKFGKEEIQKLAGRVTSPEGIFSRIGEDIADVFSNIFKGFFSPVEFVAKEEKKQEQPLEFRLTPVEKEVLKALENNVGKNMFKTKMRFIYLSRRDIFDMGQVSSFVGGLKQFNDINLNSLKPNDLSKTYAHYNFFKAPRLLYRKRKIFRRYRMRDLDGKRFFLSTEELATIYHLPDMNVVSPFVPRTESKRGGAPSNLPTG